MLDKNKLVKELQALPCGTGDGFKAKEFADKVKSVVPRSYILTDHAVDGVTLLREMFGVISYISPLGSSRNSISCFYNKDNNSFRLNEKLTSDRKKMFLAICAAKLLLWKASNQEFKNFVFYENRPLYEDFEDKKAFDLAVELLTDSYCFKNEALKHKLDEKRICEALLLPLPVVLNKLISEDLMR